MKKTATLILTLLLCLLSLSACNKDNAPEGMQFCGGGDALGFCLYVPDAWTLSSVGDIAAAYVSGLDTTAVSFARVDLPEDVDAYFKNSLDSLPDATLLTEAESAVIGGGAASKYVYTFKNGETVYRVMQLFSKHDGKLGIFTYTAKDSLYEAYGKSYFDYHMEDVENILAAFVYTSVTEEPAAPTFETDADGWRLVSDKKLTYFDLYLPDGWDVTQIGAAVGAKRDDGASVFMTRSTTTGVSVSDYLAERKTALEDLFGEVTEVRETDVKASLGNAAKAICAEYTYEKGGVTYHVLQYVAVSRLNGYVFTYTATEDCFAAHLDEVKAIAEKVVIK